MHVVCPLPLPVARLGYAVRTTYLVRYVAGSLQGPCHHACHCAQVSSMVSSGTKCWPARPPRGASAEPQYLERRILHVRSHARPAGPSSRCGSAVARAVSRCTRPRGAARRVLFSDSYRVQTAHTKRFFNNPRPHAARLRRERQQDNSHTQTVAPWTMCRGQSDGPAAGAFRSPLEHGYRRRLSRRAALRFTRLLSFTQGGTHGTPALCCDRRVCIPTRVRPAHSTISLDAARAADRPAVLAGWGQEGAAHFLWRSLYSGWSGVIQYLLRTLTTSP